MDLNLLIIYAASAIAMILPPIAVFSAYKLYRLSRSEEGRGVSTLRERADTAVILAVGAVMGGLLGTNSFTFNIFNFRIVPAGPLGILMILTILVCLSLPGILWLYRYRDSVFPKRGA